MSAYQEFTGKTVEEALRNAREAFSVGPRRPRLRDHDPRQPGRPRDGRRTGPDRRRAAPRARWGCPEARGGRLGSAARAQPRRHAARDRRPRRDDRPAASGRRRPQPERPTESTDRARTTASATTARRAATTAVARPAATTAPVGRRRPT